MKTRQTPFNKSNLISDSILSRIKQYSFARPNKFIVSFVLPPKLSTFISKTEPLLTRQRQDLINFNCYRVSVPERRLDVSEVVNSSHESRIALGGEVRPPIQLVFVCHSDMYEKYLFDIWLSFILNHKQRTLMFLSDYSTDVVITQLDQKHDPVYEITLSECFPTSLSSYYYDAQPSTTPLSIDVTFSFTSFTSDTIQSS